MPIMPVRAARVTDTTLGKHVVFAFLNLRRVASSTRTKPCKTQCFLHLTDTKHYKNNVGQRWVGGGLQLQPKALGAGALCFLLWSLALLSFSCAPPVILLPSLLSSSCRSLVLLLFSACPPCPRLVLFLSSLCPLLVLLAQRVTVIVGGFSLRKKKTATVSGPSPEPCHPALSSSCPPFVLLLLPSSGHAGEPCVLLWCPKPQCSRWPEMPAPQ